MEKYLALLKGLISIPSYSREERSAADYLENWMHTAGLPVKRIGNNLWCEEPHGADDLRPVLLLNAHIDTVRPAAGYSRDPFTAYQEGDKIYGLGSNDDGGSLISLLAVYERLRLTAQPYRLIFSATAEEEVSGMGGMDMLLPELGRVDFAIIGEPTGMQAAVAEKGLMVLDCIAHGRSGHAAREEGDNALYHAIEDIEWFRSHQFEKVSPYLGSVKMTVTQISCGSQHNVIPDRCEYVVDVRPNGMYSNEELLGLIRASVGSEVKARSTRLNSSHLEATHPVAQRCAALGLQCFGSPTTSNQTISPFSTLKIGPGDSARSHTADEYIRISEIEEGIKIYERLLTGLRL